MRAPGTSRFLANRRYAPQLKTTLASPCLRGGRGGGSAEGISPLAVLRTTNPYLAFAQAIEFFTGPLHPLGVHPTAVIAASARIGARAHIRRTHLLAESFRSLPSGVASFVSFPGAGIGANFFAHAHAVVREYCRIGDAIVSTGVVIGGDGLAFGRRADGTAQDGAVWPRDSRGEVAVQANA